MDNSETRASNDFQDLEVGSVAPDFRLPASTGGEIELSDYREKSNVILFFVREYG
jgi:peroxiredoxin